MLGFINTAQLLPQQVFRGYRGWAELQRDCSVEATVQMVLLNRQLKTGL